MAVLKRISLCLMAGIAVIALFTSSVFAKPAVRILATGGTIAGVAASQADVKDYKEASLGVAALLAAVPQLKDYADISGEQVCNVGSSSLTNDLWLKLARRCNELLASDEVQGIVITHGTDTLEETAYFLNLVVRSSKPVVLVGAMRPATAISADGPMNLLEAVRVAASPQARGKGVLVVMNDRISGARDVMKTDTTNVATFRSPLFGDLGCVLTDKILFYKTSTRRHTQDSEFDISAIKDLPRVDVIYSHVNDDGIMADAAVQAGARGIVHAGTGDGSVHLNTRPSLINAVKKGVVVVRGTRVPGGYVDSLAQYDEMGFLYSDTLSPQKARILLSLALTRTKDPKEIQRMFNEY